MDAITDKPDWNLKIFDHAIVSKWHDEAVAAKTLISEASWMWCMAELCDKAPLLEDSGRIVTLDTGSRACKSDTVISEQLRQELLAGVKPLLDVKDSKKDWHPGSDGKALNLVHPSLFPLVYGESRALDLGGRVNLDSIFGTVGKPNVVAHATNGAPSTHSEKFQWLPCDVAFVGKKGTDVRITSYINNLHPQKHASLYHTIEKFISLAIPFWNDVLVTPQGPRTQPRVLPLEADVVGHKFDDSALGWGANLEELSSEEVQALAERVKKYLRKRNNLETVADHGAQYGEDNLPAVAAISGGDSDGNADDENEAAVEDDLHTGNAAAVLRFESRLRDVLARQGRDKWDLFHVFYETVDAKFRRIRSFPHPELGDDPTYEDWATANIPGKAAVAADNASAADDGSAADADDDDESGAYEVSIERKFRDKGLQVIVKLASIELTPEKPTYDGGSWHLEGMQNEHIVATALYYYDVENTTESRLAFRQEAFLPEMELDYEQGEHDGLAKIYGAPSLQDEPALQQLGSVRSPQGRLLAFPNTLQHCVAPFELVDKTKPGHRRCLVLWLVDPHYRICSTTNVPPQRHDWWLDMVRKNADFSKMPQEVVDMVLKNVEDWPMSLERAKELRLELMAERTQISGILARGYNQYNLCEH